MYWTLELARYLEDAPWPVLDNKISVGIGILLNLKKI